MYAIDFGGHPIKLGLSNAPLASEVSQFFKDVIVDEIRQLTKRTNSIMYPTQHFQRIYDMCSEFTVVIITS